MTPTLGNQSALLPEKKTTRGGTAPPLRTTLPPGSEAVIHCEFDWMRGHPEVRDLLHLQLDVGIEHVVREHAAAGEKFASLVQVFECLLERGADIGNLLRLLG